MNLNCTRDPLTCKCDYHLGVIPPGPQLRPPPVPNSVATRLVDQYREAHPFVAEHWREGLDEVATLKAALTTDAMYAARARFNARLAARPCCRAHGTTCPACRKADYEAPRWLVRLRDLRDLLRAAG